MSAQGSWRPDSPGAQRKLDALAELEKVAADAVTDLIGLSTASAKVHLAVSSVIIGPRTLEQLESQLPGS